MDAGRIWLKPAIGIKNMPTNESQFRAFTVAYLHGFQAEADGRKDKKLIKFEKIGFVRYYDCMFGNNYYSLTESGRAALMGTEK